MAIARLICRVKLYTYICMQSGRISLFRQIRLSVKLPQWDSSSKGRSGRAESSFSLITSSCTEIKRAAGDARARFLEDYSTDLDTRHLSARTQGRQVHCARCARCRVTANIKRERIPWKFASDFRRGRIFSRRNPFRRAIYNLTHSRFTIGSEKEQVGKIELNAAVILLSCSYHLIIYFLFLLCEGSPRSEVLNHFKQLLESLTQIDFHEIGLLIDEMLSRIPF